MLAVQVTVITSWAEFTVRAELAGQAEATSRGHCSNLFTARRFILHHLSCHTGLFNVVFCKKKEITTYNQGLTRGG